MQFTGTIKKLASLFLWHQNAKWWNPSAESTVTSSKLVRIQNFLDIPKAHEQEQICIRGFMGKTRSCVSKIPQRCGEFLFLVLQPHAKNKKKRKENKKKPLYF